MRTTTKEEKMDYTGSLIWLASWPMLIYVSYKFVMINIRNMK